MKIYPEFLEPQVRDDLLANHSFYEAGQFAYLLESFAEHFLRHRPVDLVEVTLDPGFARELLASSVDAHLVAPKVASRLSQRLGRRLRFYVADRAGLGLGVEEVGLGPGDWRNVTDAPVEGDLVAHFLDNDRVVYSRPFEDELVLTAGRSVRSRFLGRTLLKRYGELYVIYQDIAEPSALQALNDIEVRLGPDREQKLMLEVEPSGRRERVLLGERLALCQLGAEHRLSLIVTPRGQDPQPPRVELVWVGISGGVVEAQAIVHEPFEMRHARVGAQLSPRQIEGEPVGFTLELAGRRDGHLQVFRGEVEAPGVLEAGSTVDLRLSGQNRSGFRLEATGTGMATVRLQRLLIPEPVGAPAFLSSAQLGRGFTLSFLLGDESAAGKRFTLHGRQGRSAYQVGPVVCVAGRAAFTVPPVAEDEDGGALQFWLSCEDPAVPLASGGNRADDPLLELPIYSIAPGGRPIMGEQNFVFSDEVLLFGRERLRIVRWAPGRPVRFPPPEHYPYFLWRQREGEALRFLLRDGQFVAEDGHEFERLRIGSGTEPRREPGELLVPIHASGRAAYLFLHARAGGALEVCKAAGRIHDVALNHEPLGATAELPASSCLLQAGGALFGLRYDPGNLEIRLLGHFLMDDDLAAGVQLTSTPDEEPDGSPAAWIHVESDRAQAVTLLAE